MTRARRRAAALLLIGLTVASCASDDSASSSPQTRPAGRTTCAELELGELPGDLELVDRTLEPLGGTVSGLVLEYRGTTGRILAVTSGGTLEDTIESYDDLTADAVVTRDGASVQLLAGAFRGRSVLAALWRDPTLAPPCDSRAVVAEGLDSDEFRRLLLTSDHD